MSYQLGLALEERLLTSKQIAATTFAVLELLALVFADTDDGETTQISIPAATLSLLASLAIVVLSHYEHT